MSTPLKPRPLRLRFHAVTIVAGSDACAEASALEGVRLLSFEAPRLPVAGCANADGCSCKFEHLADRRAGPRRSDLGATHARTAGRVNNRRLMLGRRDTDNANN